MMHWADTLWGSCQSPVAHSCSLLNHLNNYHGKMFKFNAEFYADSSLYSLSHFECEGHTVHMLTESHLQPPCWLVQWSRHCSCMCIPSTHHRYQVTTFFIIFIIMTGLFLDRPCISGSEIAWANLYLSAGLIFKQTHQKNIKYYMKL